MSLFLGVDACLSWSLPSFTEQQVSPHRLPMQYWLKNHGLSSNIPHTCSITNYAILHNNNIVAKWFVRIHTHEEKMASKGSHSSSVSSSNRLVWLQTWKKAMGWCTAQWKMLLFCAKTIVNESRKFELARLKKKKKKKKEKEKHFRRLVAFWFGTFAMLFSATGCVVHHVNTRRWMVGCYNRLWVWRFWEICLY